ncbi:hypothetical protein NP83_09405 [Neobacillus niacini]|nr:hypothetical protein NP83_09405 [Neobacillus niacini]
MSKLQESVETYQPGLNQNSDFLAPIHSISNIINLLCCFNKLQVCDFVLMGGISPLVQLDMLKKLWRYG